MPDSLSLVSGHSVHFEKNLQFTISSDFVSMLVMREYWL